MTTSSRSPEARHWAIENIPSDGLCHTCSEELVCFDIDEVEAEEWFGFLFGEDGATAAMTPKMENTTAILKFNQKTPLLLEGLKVKLKKTTGNTKSSGINPNAPITAFMSPKNGSIAAIVVATTTDNDRDITLGITFLLENSPLFGSPNILSNISFVGCNYGEELHNDKEIGDENESFRNQIFAILCEVAED
nr:proteinaceous RNase P 2 isoform X1 [Ipomoea batatas]